MSPPDLRTLVTRQTDQITILTWRLEASLACNARLKTRLVTALDTVDILHAELDAERRKNDKYLWMNLVQELQREKDDMKEVVELLIRKVERSKGDLDRWSSAMMFLPSPAARSSKPMHYAPIPVVPPRMETLLHALSVERGRCRRGADSLQDAHETILTLEAQVARLEAELESRDHRSIADAGPVPGKRSLLGTLNPNLPEVSLSETFHSLGMREEYNHVLEQEVNELDDRLRKHKHSSCCISVAVQTSPVESEAPRSPPCSPLTTPTRTGLPLTEAKNDIEDLEAHIDLLSDAIDGFSKERQTVRDALGSRREPTDVGSNHKLPSELPPEPPSPHPPLPKTLPSFQQILRVEQECVRLTHINECLERELAELRTAASPASRISSISFMRSPALPSPTLPTTSPNSFSVRSSGERDMEISTPLRSSASLPDNRLSDFDFFLGHTQPPAPDNSSVNAEPPGDDTANAGSQEAKINFPRHRSSSAPDIGNTHLSILSSPFQLSRSLPPRSESAEPSSGHQERTSEP